MELPKELLTLADFVDAKPESLVLGDAEIQSAALEATKFLFDRGAQTRLFASHSLLMTFQLCCLSITLLP